MIHDLTTLLRFGCNTEISHPSHSLFNTRSLLRSHLHRAKMAALSVAPVIRSVSDSASFAITAAPYLEQLPALPARVYAALSEKSVSALVDLFASTNPLLSGCLFALFLGVVAFIAGEVNKNYSQVDRMWSIVPMIYFLHYNLWARQTGIASARLDLALLCVTLWGTRLTYNFWRKGGYYKGGEDYRWEMVRDYLTPLQMSIFNLIFISFIQTVRCPA